MYDEVPRYKKKAKKKTAKKANHKHRFENCVLGFNTVALDKAHGFVPYPTISIGAYCPVCGKIGPINIDDWFEDEYKDRMPTLKVWKKRWNDRAQREFDPCTRTLPYFWLDDQFQKYVKL